MSKRLLLIAGLILGVALLFWLADFYQSFLLGAIGLLAIATVMNWVAPILLGNSEQRLLRHFQRQPSVRLQLVKDIVNRTLNAPKEVVPLEMVAVFALLLAKRSRDEVVQRMLELSNEGWRAKFDDDFFQQLEWTIRDFRVKGLAQEYRTLIQFGETAAQQHQPRAWADKFRQLRDQVLQREVDKEPVFRYRR
jgi:hypothetical protein